MSYHTSSYLNSGNIMIGNTQNNGNAWWYNQNLENPDKPSHYTGFLPLELVKSRLFGWSAWESFELLARFRDPVNVNPDGSPVIYEVPAKSFKAIGREDWIVNGVPEDEEAGADAILHVQGDSYGTHQLKEIFITNLAEIVGGADELGIESAMLLKWGRIASMTISISENLHNDASGLKFRPQLIASTSFNSSLPTSYTRAFGIPVCDNTLNYELMRAGDDQKFVIKHTKNSVSKLAGAAEALGLLTQQADDMDAELTRMVNREVSGEEFSKWLNLIVPIPELKEKEVTQMVSIQGEMQMGTVKKVSTNGQTIAINKQAKLLDMWASDPRVAPWGGTQFGVLQLWNTFQQHESKLVGAKALDGNRLQARVENNMMKTLSGKFANGTKTSPGDLQAMEYLDRVFEESAPIIAVSDSGNTAVLEKAPAKRKARGSAANQNADNN
jgi:hypothetical protein